MSVHLRLDAHGRHAARSVLAVPPGARVAEVVCHVVSRKPRRSLARAGWCGRRRRGKLLGVGLAPRGRGGLDAGHVEPGNSSGLSRSLRGVAPRTGPLSGHVGPHAGRRSSGFRRCAPPPVGRAGRPRRFPPWRGVDGEGPSGAHVPGAFACGAGQVSAVDFGEQRVRAERMRVGAHVAFRCHAFAPRVRAAPRARRSAVSRSKRHRPR